MTSLVLAAESCVDDMSLAGGWLVCTGTVPMVRSRIAFFDLLPVSFDGLAEAVLTLAALLSEGVDGRLRMSGSDARAATLPGLAISAAAAAGRLGLPLLVRRGSMLLAGGGKYRSSARAHAC